MSKHVIASSLVLLLGSAPVFADLTADELWADWQNVYAGFGGTITADNATKSGDTLSLEGVSLNFAIAGAESTSNYGNIDLVEQSDGTVRIVLPASMTVTSSATVEGQTQDQTFTITPGNFEGIVRQDGDVRTYDLTSDSLSYGFGDLSGGEAEAPVEGAMVISNMVASYVNRTDGDILASDQSLTASAVTLTATSEGAEAVDFNYVMQNVTSDGTGTINTAAQDGPVSLADMGILFSGNVNHAGSTTVLNVMTEDGPVNISGTSQSGGIGFDFGADSFGYTLTSKDVQMGIQVAAFPLPINLTMAEATTGIALPVGTGEEAKPFALNMAYRDLTIPDALWGLFDPTGQLPRDPATLLVDLTGTAEMKVDIFSGDPEALAAVNGPPGELQTMDLNQLQLTFGGAELRGNGALEFPVPGPVPQPVGTINLALDGGLGLLDKLVALGFVPADQAAFVKGMAGVVAKPVGEDQLESEIVFSEGGGISANGLPLQ